MTKYIPTVIPINTLSGGVGRQAPSKRLPTEAQTLENVFCTLEKSIERRSGTDIVLDVANNPVDLGVYSGNTWHQWFAISSKDRFLICLDKTGEIDSEFLKIYKLRESGALEKVDSMNITIETDCYYYLTYMGETSDNNLKPVAIGTSLLILNTEVKAGFTSDGIENNLYNLDGTLGDILDDTGREVVYQTAAPVDRRGEATIWSNYSFYIPGDQVIDKGDDHPDEVKYKGIWQVSEQLDGQALQPNDGSNSLHPYFAYRNDTDRGTIENIEDDIALPADTAVGDTYYIVEGGTPSAGWGTFRNEDAITGDPLDTVLTTLPGTIQIRCVTADGSDSIWRVNKWQRVRDSLTNEPRYTEHIPVKDYVYPDADTLYLGQAVTDVSKLRLPPDSSDTIDFNNAEPMLRKLYPNVGDADGRGKVYYFTSTYGSMTPGYYRVKSTDTQPYLHNIRTPDSMSIIDNKRMPMQLDYNSDTGTWMLRKVGWDPRQSGTEASNPGPSPFRDGDDKAVQVALTSIAFYRDRLFLAAGDKLFSSRLGNWDNFWIKDPGTIVATDPIDLSVSSNKYSPIHSMVPFNDYLFLNSAGDTQFELIGSENQITPFTAEIAPTTFYSTIAEIDPQLMGNQIYFFAKERLYIYFGQSQTNINQAVDVSTHCPGYLPNNPLAITTSPSHNSIYFVDGDVDNEIFTYTNRFSGDQVVQNAFFKHVLNPNIHVQHLQVFENLLYLIIKQDGADNTQMITMELDSTNIDYSKPVLDLSVRVGNGEWLPDSGITMYTIGGVFPNIDQGIVVGGIQAGIILDVESTVNEDLTTTISIRGNTVGNNIVVGTSFKSIVQLSEQFVRDDKNNVLNGVLNLRSISLRHSHSGNYDLKLSRRGRLETIFNFVPFYVGTTGDTPFPFENIEQDGEFLVRAFGLSSELDIKIESEYPVTFNITNIESRAKFNVRDSLLERR